MQKILYSTARKLCCPINAPLVKRVWPSLWARHLDWVLCQACYLPRLWCDTEANVVDAPGVERLRGSGKWRR